MDPKPRPNQDRYIEALRRLGPEGRLLKALELSETMKQLFIDGLKHRHPDLDDEAFRKLAIEQLARCHNRNY